MAAICVFCSSSDLIPVHYLELAAEVGAEIGRQGHSLISGGGSVGCMGAVARGARAAGAHTVGVIPEALRLREVADLEADELVVTPDMRTRKGEMDRRADGFLILPGGLGTLEELLEIWTARHLGMHSKPVVVLDRDGLFAPLRTQLDRLRDEQFLSQAALDEVTWTTSISAAVATFG